MHYHFVADKTLIMLFEDFYAKILEKKSLIESGGMSSISSKNEDEVLQNLKNTSSIGMKFIKIPEKIPENIGSTNKDKSPDQFAEEILVSLHNAIKEQMHLFYKKDAQLLQEAQYAMVALADEVFLHMKWPGISYWERHLLEERAFGTHVAGRNFFKNIDDLLSVRDIFKEDMAQIYLIALGVGFRGKYGRQSSEKNENEIAMCKKQLLNLVLSSKKINQDKFESEDAHLFEQSYGYTMENVCNFRTPHKNFINYILLFMILIYVTASFFVWRSNTTDLLDQIDNILSLLQ